MAVGAYERVRFIPGGTTRATTVILANVVERGGFLTGIEVDKQGDEVAAVGFDERRHIIDLTCIRRRTPLRMDNKYAELVDA